MTLANSPGRPSLPGTIKPLATDVSRETSERLELLVELLIRWSSTSPLISKDDQLNLFHRHINDSLALLPLLGSACEIADLGAGAGFPGLVLAIAGTRPVTLIEANKRKAAFLREAARLTAAPVTIKSSRIEAMIETFDLISARAVAPLGTLFALVHPRLRTGARCLFPKGRTFCSEVNEAARRWGFDLTEHPSATASDARILEISNLRPRVFA